MRPFQLYDLMDRISEKAPLQEHGVREAELPLYAANVMETQQLLLKNNYIPLNEAQILEIYKEAY